MMRKETLLIDKNIVNISIEIQHNHKEYRANF